MKAIGFLVLLTFCGVPASAINLNELMKQKIQEAVKKAAPPPAPAPAPAPAPKPAPAPAPAPAPYKENCANILSHGGFLFAAWASAPLAPESEIKKLWDSQMKHICQKTECPLFCSEENGNVPPELLSLQKKCRNKDVAACDSFFKTIKVDNQGPTNLCFYIGGKACDFCDRFGGEYCAPGMRFGRQKQDVESMLMYKIACSSGFTEACNVLSQKSLAKVTENQTKCSEQSDEDACRTRISYLIDLGKITEAVGQTMRLCQKSHYKICNTFIPRMHKDFPSSNGVNFKKAFREALEPECKKRKQTEACFVLDALVRSAQEDDRIKDRTAN